MNIRPIRTARDHDAALKQIAKLWDAEIGTAEHDALDILATLVDAYERAHVPIEPPSAVEALKFRLEQGSLTRKDLEPILGSRARVTEILNESRGLTLKMIRGLHRQLKIPLDVLIGAEESRPVRIAAYRKAPARKAHARKTTRPHA